MPLYLVRWPGLVASLINAKDEDQLVRILDETENPEGCTWSVYRGALNLEFTLNAEFEIDEPDGEGERPLAPEQLKLRDVSKICERDVMRVMITSNSDTAWKMEQAIMQAAFPALHKLLKSDAETLPEDKVQAALRMELDLLIKASWQHQQTKRPSVPTCLRQQTRS